MRTLCLSLQKPSRPAWAESILTFSPRVHYREPGLVFADVGSTAHLFGGEVGLMQEVRRLCEDLFPEAQASLSDSPSAAQVLTQTDPFTVMPPLKEREYLGQLPLKSLVHLEGLIAWRATREIENIIDFFYTLGLKQIGELQRFSLMSFRERWGETGTLLWRRLHGEERQVISPMLPREPMTDYVHFDFGVSLLPFLLHSIDRSLRRLVARLQGRGEFARKVLLHLHCEYDQQYHLVEIAPTSPHRNHELLMKLIEHRLVGLELSNPIREMTTEIITAPESVQQLDFWQPRESDRDKWLSLVSLLNQAEITTGFLRPQSELLPELSWSVTPEPVSESVLEDVVDMVTDSESGAALRLRPTYSQSLSDSPRPTKILREPEPLDERDLRGLRWLRDQPLERIEEGWWDDSRGRDYHVAVSPEGQTLWIFYDQLERRYYLQGYFD